MTQSDPVWMVLSSSIDSSSSRCCCLLLQASTPGVGNCKGVPTARAPRAFQDLGAHCFVCEQQRRMAPRRSTGRQSSTPQQQLAPPNAAEVRRLQAAAINGESASAVAAYLSAGGSPTAIVEVQNGGDHIKGPLIAAMIQRNRHPHTELAQSIALLMNAGADINATCTQHAGYGRTALMWASGHNCCSNGVQLLLQHGADPCKLNFDGVSALHMAAGAGAVEHCQLLIDATGARTVNLRDGNDMTPVAYATTAAKSLAVIELLHRHGADLKVRICAPQNITLLQYAADCNEVAIVKYLLRSGVVDVNAVTSCNQTAVCSAAQKGRMQAAQVLLEHGADPTIANNLGQNALFTAALGGHVQMMELMLQHGRLKISSSTNNTGATLLTAAADKGHTAAVVWLLEQQHMPVDDTDCEGMTALHFAARSGLAAMITLLLQHGADIHKRSKHGQSALDLAAGQGFAESVQALIAADASVVAQTESTRVVALHWAVVFEAHCCSASTAESRCSSSD
eukprot:4102-Heterococcus_DN1.PRE.2